MIISIKIDVPNGNIDKVDWEAVKSEIAIELMNKVISYTDPTPKSDIDKMFAEIFGFPVTL